MKKQKISRIKLIFNVPKNKKLSIAVREAIKTVINMSADNLEFFDESPGHAISCVFEDMDVKPNLKLVERALRSMKTEEM